MVSKYFTVNILIFLVVLAVVLAFVPHLHAQGRTDAVSSYITNEPWILEQADIKPGIISPQTYGVDFYSDCLFTTEQETEKRPQRVKKFREASLRGWRYAMDHQEEIIELLIKQYAVNKSRDHLRYEARTMENLIFPKLIEMGHMNPGRWQHIADTFSRLLMVWKFLKPKQKSQSNH